MVRYVLIGIGLLLLSGGVYLLWNTQGQTQTTTTVDVKSLINTPTPVKDELSSDLTLLDRDLVDLDNLDSDYQTNIDNLSSQPATLTRVKLSLDKSLEGYDMTADITQKILDKIQVQIDKAKTQGKVVTSQESTMKDSRKLLSTDQSKLDEVQKLKLTATTKAHFTAIRDSFKAVKIDLLTVKAHINLMLEGLSKLPS